MLLGIRVENFKSIREAHVRFGALTCLIGHNGAGKSNLFDAIHLLSELAERDIHEASAEVRRTSDGVASPLDLVLARDPANVIKLSADMIVPPVVVDDFDQEAEPSTTLLTYTVHLKYKEASDRLAVEFESLTHAKLGDFANFVAFPHSQSFRGSVTEKSRRGGPLISTDVARGAIMLHGDGGSRGRPAPVGRSPLTVVGGTNTFDYPTVLAAKREMASWRMLHLEPSSMRSPDARSAPGHVSASGAHIASTLRKLVDSDPDTTMQVVNRLRQLNSDVQDLEVYSDQVRDQFALRAKIPGVSEWLFGRSLSDGTLRYIALALMLVDVQDRAVLCLEEPENGIHPSRIPALVDLMYDYAVDLTEPVADDNPLRQVTINTHSPEVARQLNIDDLVFVERARSVSSGVRTVFRPIEGTWRTAAENGNALAAKDRQAVADFIGGSPIRSDHGQLSFDFGTAQ